MPERIYLSPPHQSGGELRNVLDALSSNWITSLGPQVDKFEIELADYVGAAGAVALSSGTAAIHLALRLLGVAPGDSVFCSTLTFVASANPILYQGAQPVFIDSEPKTWNLSSASLERALSAAVRRGPLPRALVLVNLYGQSADMDAILPICRRYGVPVVEDAAESLGATYRGKASGTFGQFGIFSFNGNKIITTSGGGMIVSDDLDALKKVRFWATQSRDPAHYYLHSEVGYNYRMSNILASIGRAQLDVLNERVAARREIFDYYRQELSSFDGLTFMPEIDGGCSTRWLTVLLVDEDACGVTADNLVEAMERENIEARRVWKPLHSQPLFQGADYYPHDVDSSISEDLFRRGLCLPSGSSLSRHDQDRILDCIRRCLEVGPNLVSTRFYSKPPSTDRRISRSNQF